MSRLLEVNHKMNLERSSADEANVWTAIADSFDCDLASPTEASVYGELVISPSHTHSVRQCVARARDLGRSMRDHISEEMWLHLNLTHLELAHLSFTSILGSGRSEFNRRIETFAEAFHGLAADTMIRGESWSFLQMGKFVERATMICRILEIKRKTLTLAPESEGAPVDVHQWQALLRSLSGYEPYRRAYDARIVPEQVLEFVIRRPDFPRSLTFAIAGVRSELQAVSGNSPAQVQLKRDVDLFLEELVRCDTTEQIRNGSFEIELRRFERRCSVLTDELDLAYFASLRPLTVAPMAAPVATGSTLLPR